MPDLKGRAIQGAVKAFRLARLVVVAAVCLLIGVSARQLFDAYGKDMIPFFREVKTETEAQVILSPHEDGKQGTQPSF
jgi:hypothetical protein